MSGSSQRMRRRMESIRNLGTVVHTMKALAAASIGQFEESVRALEDYYQALVLGLSVCLRDRAGGAFPGRGEEAGSAVIVFGSSQGLVGPFNEALAAYVAGELRTLRPAPEIWMVGERLWPHLEALGLVPTRAFAAPQTVQGIRPLIGHLLSGEPPGHLHLMHHRPASGALFEPVRQRLLPLDERWVEEMAEKPWPGTNLPEPLGGRDLTLNGLVREYLYVTLFKAVVESLAAENASRLAAMQRAERNIEEKLRDLESLYHRVRQASIDEELFDIIAGFEALRGKDR